MTGDNHGPVDERVRVVQYVDGQIRVVRERAAAACVDRVRDLDSLCDPPRDD